MEMSDLALGAIVLCAIGGVVYALGYPYLSSRARAQKRQAAAGAPRKDAMRVKDRNLDANQRRKQVADSLKDLEQRGKTKKLKLEEKLAQAGLVWSRSQYIMVSAASATAAAVLLVYMSGELLYGLPGLVIGGIGLPSWFIGFRKKRRINKFIIEFPNAIDVIVRGIKAGLPFASCLQIVANEASDPVRGEFRRVIEAGQMGVPASEALEQMAKRVPVPETNFFAIVIAVQQKAGGNLSEALGNLSRVLRDRKKMQQKVKAMSSEAKASAGIIGSLPIIVVLLLYVSSPRYVELLWITNLGRVVMAISGFWMFLGIMSMKKMIAFDM